MRPDLGSGSVALDGGLSEEDTNSALLELKSGTENVNVICAWELLVWTDLGGMLIAMKGGTVA